MEMFQIDMVSLPSSGAAKKPSGNQTEKHATCLVLWMRGVGCLNDGQKGYGNFNPKGMVTFQSEGMATFLSEGVR